MTLSDQRRRRIASAPGMSSASEGGTGGGFEYVRAVPAPGTAALFGLGALAMRRRR